MMLLSLALALFSFNEEIHWRDTRNCGRVTLYAYLSILGAERSLNELASHVPIDNIGSSLLDLRNAASTFGVKSTIVKNKDKRLDNLEYPCIAHYETERGHFVLLLSQKNDSVVVADFSLGRIDTHPIDYFKSRWSGYCMMPKRSWNFSLIQRLIAVCVFISIIFMANEILAILRERVD